MRKAIILLACGLLIAGHPSPGGGAPAAPDLMSESHYLDLIRAYSSKKDYAAVEKTAAAFFKAYPRSKQVPDVRLILAESEPAPDEAIKKYRIIISNYKYYPRLDYAQYRICEIHYLRSSWKELASDARAGLGLGKSEYGRRFMFFLIISLIHRGEYDSAERECRRFIDANHDYNDLARSMLILAHIYRNEYGLSREYINTIREIILGYGNAEVSQTALFMLAEFYERKKQYDESYSAYMDLIEKYPGSPEASDASVRIKSIMKHHPRRVFYLPGRKIVEDAESIDISPEKDIPEESTSFFYSISVGPFVSLGDANGVKRELNEFDTMRTVRLKKGYALYVGRCPDEESVLKLKIRLAEEYGINGRIVRISGDGERSYIYGE
ncbi:MAG: hypothetical protein A2176_12975 [Spirochaetes bacterium RBG_13_51_14]|nr:MAG: hypothetical protein A2176_12975 [Spirochaetes bacterium RBG_13_51_14]